MRIRINNNSILNFSFALFIITELFFSYTLFSQLTLLFFCGVSIISSVKIYKNPFALSYIAFTVFSFMIIALGYAIDRSVALDMTKTVLLNCLFLFAFTQYCGVIGDPVEILKVYKTICIPAAAVSFILGFSGALAGQRLEIEGINANAVGMFVAYSLVIHISEMYKKRRADAKDILILVLFVVVLIFSASRKALLIAIIGWYVLLCLRHPKRTLKYTAIIAVAAVVVLNLVLRVDFLYKIVGNRLESVVFLLQGLDIEEGSLLTREHYLKYAWERSQNSLIFGHGLDCFHTLPEAYGVYSHCNYLELLFSVGWVGVIIYYSTSLLTILKLPKILKVKAMDMYLLLAIFIPYLICDYMNVTYFTRRMLIIPSIAIMFLRRCANEKNSQTVKKSI